MTVEGHTNQFPPQFFQIAEAREEFIEATKDSDNDRVAELLESYPEADFNEVTDTLGNTPLTLAVKNDNSQVNLIALIKHPLQRFKEG